MITLSQLKPSGLLCTGRCTLLQKCSSSHLQLFHQNNEAPVQWILWPALEQQMVGLCMFAICSSSAQFILCSLAHTHIFNGYISVRIWKMQFYLRCFFNDSKLCANRDNSDQKNNNTVMQSHLSLKLYITLRYFLSKKCMCSIAYQFHYISYVIIPECLQP